MAQSIDSDFAFKDRPRAELFVGDFVLTHLVGKDINEIWHVKNPMGLLTKVLEESGRQAPESRSVINIKSLLGWADTALFLPM